MTVGIFARRFGRVVRRNASRRPMATGSALRFEACEPRRVLSAGPVDLVTPLTVAADVWTASAEDDDHGEAAHGDVEGEVVDGRLVTNLRSYGYEFEPDTFVFDVGFDVKGLAAESVLELQVLQGVTFWNGRGDTPRFVPARGGVELNFKNATESVRVGASRNVGRSFEIGVAEPVEGGTEVHDHFDVNAGIGGNGETFQRRAPDGIYAVVGRLVGDGAESSAPMAFVFNLGGTEEAHEAAVEFFQTSPPVSVFGVTTPAGGNYGLGRPIQVTYQFSDPVAVRGNPRLPITIGGKPRAMVIDRAASSGENVVFSYTPRAGDRGAVRPQGNQLRIQLPQGSRISGEAGGVAFPAFAVNWPNIQTLTSRPRVTRATIETADGNYGDGEVIDFRLTWDRVVGISPGFDTGPTIQVRAIGGAVLGNAEWSSLGATDSSYLFRYFVKAGDTAPRGIQVTGPISLNGSTIKDLFNNDSILTFTAARAPRVRIVPS